VIVGDALFQHTRQHDKCAIVGTAHTWRDTPWDDPGLAIMELNDAACSLKFPRVDVHFEMHPLSGFVYWQPGGPRMSPDSLPPGRYLRPVGYLDWLKTQSQTIPVLLHDAPPEDWTNAEQYPLQAICERYRDILQIDPTWGKPYAASGPAWMMLYALAQGYTEIHIYGIHLATEREYQDQRPNFECLIGYAIAQGVKIVLPRGTPICKATSVYCYEPRVNQAEDGSRWRLERAETKRAQIAQEIMDRSWYESSRALRNDLVHWTAKQSDLKQQLGRVVFAGQIQRPEWRDAVRG
jgi:hypothetical protein